MRTHGVVTAARNGIIGTLQAFPKGPVKPAFEDLVYPFTGIKPNIKEMSFGSWVLGRDHLQPDSVKYDGVLKFSGGRFNEGLVIDDDVSVSMPSVSNLKLEEGTFSAWIKPEWGGIYNDATLTFDIESIGENRFEYRPGDDLFDFEKGFDVLESKNIVGGTDFSGPYISIYNHDKVFGRNGVREERSVGVFAIRKYIDSLSRVTDSVYIDKRAIHRGKPKSITASVPFTYIVNDGNASIAMNASLVALTVDGSRNINRAIELNIKEKGVRSAELPEYERYHATRTCDCIIEDSVEEMLKFGTDAFDNVKIKIPMPINISHIFKNKIISKSVASEIGRAFVLMDPNGKLY